MMKFIFFLLGLLFSNIIEAQLPKVNEQFTFTGRVIGQKDTVVTLKYYTENGNLKVDSCVLKNGSFYFKGNIPEPTIAFFRGEVKSNADDDPNATSFYLESGAITATVKKNHFKEIKIMGSKTQTENEILQKMYERVDDTSNLAYEEYETIDSQFILKNTDSYISSFKLWLHKGLWPLETVSEFYEMFTPKIQESHFGKEVKKTINEIDNNSNGKMAKSFSANTINGEVISLADFKGKYVLLDFWASWCVPCRQGIPHLKTIYEKYHPKGLNIIAISSDDKIKAWKDAVEKDGSGIWYNILSSEEINKSEEFEDSLSVGKKFGIQVLPTKILIDKNGKIIGRYTGTEDDEKLYEKLKSIFE